jgi:hypothetical protein
VEGIVQRAAGRYSDLAIVTALTLRALFHLPLHQTEGFVGSLLRSRKPVAQRREAMILVNVLNRMTALRMPESCHNAALWPRAAPRSPHPPKRR